MAQGIFPDKDADFNDYFGIVSAYLVTNAVRLLVNAGNLTALNNFITNWPPLYSSSQNPSTATKTIIDNKNIMRDDIEELLRAIYDDIPKSVLTTDDRNTLNLKERKPASPRQPITTAPGVILTAMPGRKVLVECRVAEDSTRPSKHPDCDVVECRYTLEDNTGDTPAPSPGEPTPVPKPEPVPVIISSGKARFIIQLAEDDDGKMITLQARWKNVIDESKSGPWSNPTVTMVGW